MLKTLDDTYFDTLEKTFYFLTDLPLKKLYGAFSSYGRFPPIPHYFCNNLLKTNSLNTCNLYSPCTSAQNVFSALNRMFLDKEIDNSIKACEHLNYWIYDNIKNIATCDEVENFYQALNQMKLSYVENIRGCEIKKFAINKDQFIIKEKLFLLAQILHWIKEANKYILPIDYDVYNKYIDVCVKFYKDHICKNIATIKEDYSDEFKNFESNFVNAVSFLEEKGVNIEQDKLECPHDSQNRQTGERSAREEDQAQEASVGPTGDREREVERLPGPPGLEGSPRPQMTLSGGGYDSTDQVPTEVAVSGDSLGAVIPGKVGTIGTTLAGSSLFLVMMYKYTPFGSWINTRVLKKDKLMENMNKNNYELLLNDVGNYKTSLNDPMYHIRYNSLTNQ
ncbi:VIR protein [Plasmodium vivax]|uniref:VIR protein n=1 Tax=Plasmodium vivax TaxID=5855 RepID=A0A1G4GR51_PLAVI|nr:VIR protein [Plasmodium vivax]